MMCVWFLLGGGVNNRRSLFDVALNLKVVFFLSRLKHHDTLEMEKTDSWLLADTAVEISTGKFFLENDFTRQSCLDRSGIKEEREEPELYKYSS